jgi:serine/threonine-protein kinase
MSDTAILEAGVPSRIRPGLIIAGKYRLERELGRGSMGTVYRAVHVTLGQRVAIKLISGEHLPSSEARKRFSVEAKAAAKLRSRHVVQVYDDGETPEGDPYIVLEYLDGETLEQRLEREHDVALADAVRIVVHVARALARAHARGIVHRDLKPANIFLVKSEDDEVGWIAKVLDFGIAKLDGQGETGTTQAGTVLGTPLFMSPEQVRGASSVAHRADLYSLGMCLFHMLTGDYAYYSTNYNEILIGICTLPLPFLRSKAPWAPEAVEQWFQRACAKEPLERFQSADEMSEALQAAGGGMPLSKHKSIPEGRIAPETLVGYAPPGLTLLDPGPAGLARTQQLVREGNVAAPAAPIPIAVSSAGPRSDTSPQWRPPRKGLPPAIVGIGLGVVVVVVVGVLLALLAGGSRPAASTRRAEIPLVASAPGSAVSARAAAEPRASLEATPERAPAAPVSSAAEVTSARVKPHAEPARPKKAGALFGPRPATKPSPPPPSKPAGSDLGF